MIYFGALGVLDWFHGTDGSARAAKKKARAAKGVSKEQVVVATKEGKTE